MKVALYARVSTMDKGQDPETQLLKLRTIAEARGYEIVASYHDMASGAKMDRPALQSMLNAAMHHGFDLIMITKLDRMMRSTTNMLTILGKLESWKVGLQCTDQDIDTKTPEGRMITIMLSAVAEFERELIVSRVKDGVARAKAEGKHCGRPKGSKDTKKRVRSK